MGLFKEHYTRGHAVPPLFFEKISAGGGFEVISITMIFDFAEIRSQVGKLI